MMQSIQRLVWLAEMIMRDNFRLPGSRQDIRLFLDQLAMHEI
jgi:hypothetical protein